MKIFKNIIIGSLAVGLPAVGLGGWLVMGMHQQHQKQLGDRRGSTFHIILRLKYKWWYLLSLPSISKITLSL